MILIPDEYVSQAYFDWYWSIPEKKSLILTEDTNVTETCEIGPGHPIAA